MKIKELDALAETAHILSNAVDDTTKIIAEVEAAITKKNKFKFEFTHHADYIENIFISWKKNKKKKNCKIYIKMVGTDIDRPMTDLPVTLRIEMIKYLPAFLEAFNSYMIDTAVELEDTIAKMKSELECY